MKKTVKRIMSTMLALVLVVGTAQVPAREASAKGTKTYISSEGYQVEYCSDDFYGSRVGLGYSFKETQTPSVAKLYKDKIKQLKKKKKYKKGLSSVQLKIGKGAKVLVVTPTKNLYSDGATIKVDLYQAVKGKVKYICALKSNGTSYPVAYTKKAVLVASNHFAGKLEIDNGKATYSLISNFLVEKGKPVLTKYSVSNNKFKKISSKKISKKKAEKDFYYCDMKGNLRGEVIGFE